VKYHGKTPFNNHRNRKVKQALFWGGYQWERTGKKERVKESEYGGCTLYLCMKIEQ
jgi:hypothetical protein